jgi:GNAT superfamily N-acetyltransferase
VTVSYRQPGLDDINALAQLHVLCWQQAYAGILPEEYLKNLSVEQRVDGWRKSLNDPDVFSIIACADASIVGFASAGPARTNIREAGHLGDGEIYAIYNHQDFYRRGIGRKFLAEAASFWLSRQGKALAIFFISQNARAESFYRAMGATPAWEGTCDIGGISVGDRGYVLNNLPELAAYSMNQP